MFSAYRQWLVQCILVVVDIYVVSCLNVHQNYTFDREKFDKDTEVSTSFTVNKGMDLRQFCLDLTSDNVEALPNQHRLTQYRFFGKADF